jgi:hypothetical protein
MNSNGSIKNNGSRNLSLLSVASECKSFEFTASVYLDRQLDENRAGEYRAHIMACDGCRQRLEETEQASMILKGLERPPVPRELRSYVMNEVARRATNQVTLGERAYEWLLKLNPKPVAYVTGVIVSIISFAALSAGLKPIPVSEMKPVYAASIPVVSGSDVEFHSYNDLPPDLSVASNLHYYQLPRVLDDGALVSFSNVAYNKPGDETMYAMVEVGPDGRATLVDMLGEPKDPTLIEQLWWSLQDRTFQPAIVSGRPVATRIILLVEKVDVHG